MSEKRRNKYRATHVLFTTIFTLLSIALWGQSTPEGRRIARGEPVPPFFLQDLKGGWQSSEKAFSTPGILWVEDIFKADTTRLRKLDAMRSDRIHVYIIDINTFMELSERKNSYRKLKLESSVLFDHKKYTATAYNVQQVPAWFLVDNNNVLIAFDREGRLATLLSAIKPYTR